MKYFRFAFFEKRRYLKRVITLFSSDHDASLSGAWTILAQIEGIPVVVVKQRFVLSSIRVAPDLETMMDRELIEHGG